MADLENAEGTPLFITPGFYYIIFIYRYDRDFLLQFMMICKEKQDNLPPLEAIGLEPVDQRHSMNRSGSGRRGVSGAMGPPSASRSTSIAGLGITGTGFGKAGFESAMGQFSAPGKLASSEERFNRSTSMSAGGGPLSSFTGGGGGGGGRLSPMV